MPNLQLENFDQSEASIQSHMTTMEASDWSKFSDGRFDIFEQDYFTLGQILTRTLFQKKISKKLTSNQKGIFFFLVGINIMLQMNICED